MTEKAKLVEYQEIQHLRDLWSKGMATWGQILLPISFAIVSYFLKMYIDSGNDKFLWVGWLLFLFVMLFWRVEVYLIDQQIVGLYPRLLEIESDCEMEAQASYYFRNLNRDAKNYLAKRLCDDVDNVTCTELRNWDYRALRKYISNKGMAKKPHDYLLEVWDEFKHDKWASWLPSVNYSVTGRGHIWKNFIIVIVIVIWFVCNMWISDLF
jgi:hypothetical protein